MNLPLSDILHLVLALSLLTDSADCQTYSYDYGYTATSKQYTRKIILKQGTLQGVVVGPRVNHLLPHVEQYLGIPYAAAPVGDLRFMAPSSAPIWYGVKYADSFGPVCPQRLPEMKHMERSRKEYFQRLVQHFMNQSEDCLYLNIYAPVQDRDPQRTTKRYPVIVFLHGESFEWNSGNPYDGSILAAYGKVVVVTLNFRLGILGFLKVGLETTSSSNFGLLDQVAALLWVRENIAAFGGDPDAVTLMGHGTGAVCASLLMLSPMIMPDGKNPLFRRSILMSGNSLADWALAGSPLRVTYQVAETLNCPSDNQKFATCLRKKRLNEIMSASAGTAPFVTIFGPIVDGIAVLNDPKKSMTTYNDMFKRFEIMYGLTEVESINLLGPVALTHGLLEKERDQELGKYLHNRCEMKRELCVARTLSEYEADDFTMSDQMYGGIPITAKAVNARDTLLDILSDARTAAPVAQMAKYHSILNPESYFYVFGHTTDSRDFLRNKTTHGEELPYIFGVPLDGPRFHFIDQYTIKEKLLSEYMMTLWTNFAYSGNPNVNRRNDFLSLGPKDWDNFDIVWPEFDIKQEAYLYLGIPPKVQYRYREKELIYWNQILPELLRNRSIDDIHYKTKPNYEVPNPPYKPSLPASNVPFWLHPKPISKATAFGIFSKPPEQSDNKYGIVKLEPDKPELAQNVMSNERSFGTIVTSPPEVKTSGVTMHVLLVIGGAFLIVNFMFFVALYYKCTRLKKRNISENRIYESRADVLDDDPEKLSKMNGDISQNGCGIIQMISRSTKSEDTYEAVRVSGEERNSSKYKLSRQLSASTIDPHTKVRDWIVQKCSPKFVRRAMAQDIYEQRQSPINQQSVIVNHIRQDSKTTQGTSTLGRSPTRPVSPTETQNVAKKAEKVSVAVDATPGARGASVMRQQPIELTKSLEYFNNRRSSTPLNSSSSSLEQADPVEIIKIEHAKPKPELTLDIYAQSFKKNLTTFQDPDINVTSKSDDDEILPVTDVSPEEALQTIKRRNYPKVLPNFPDNRPKRMSMPVGTTLHIESSSSPNSPTGRVSCRFPPPQPPPRGCSTLGRKSSTLPLTQSPAILAEEPPDFEEPEMACNNLFVGPLLPRNKTTDEVAKIYDALKSAREDKVQQHKMATTVITTDPISPIKKIEPKYIVKPTINKNVSLDKNKAIPRVVMKDGTGQVLVPPKPTESDDNVKKILGEATHAIDGESKLLGDGNLLKTKTPSLIPKLVKCSAVSSKESSAESSPSSSPSSEESETGTVINKL